ncbi:3-deoxy-D-manno-octulosonic acid kinase [Thalassotalea sp. M1531]|uniref:3-deoxy-D-manno-octulosonic acid kinase n=1 Tax=Thalassotalea algicola TaxID=2716224 RepID=A0A7Y0LFA3_9GAMM|nr:3-deoxy-D-manno-octulosonic acid kinase [Thalassotalea algicola]
MVKSGQASLHQSSNQWCLFNTKLVTDFDSKMLQPDFWQSTNAVTGTAQGRGTTYFVTHQDSHWVLRHYYRGGLIGKLLTDSYLYLGLAKTRAIQEYLLLAQLTQWQLPAPTPIACQITRSGIHYKGDILTDRINNANDLYTILKTSNVSEGLWKKIGVTIARFHLKKVNHHDLNIHNILIDDSEKVWLIDFDQGSIKQGDGWQQSNIDRLLRSFRKELAKNPSMHWQETDWQLLINSYQQAMNSN